MESFKNSSTIDGIGILNSKKFIVFLLISIHASSADEVCCSRTVREDWTTEDALSGSGEED